MTGYTEISKPGPEPGPDFQRLFYTIAEADVGKGTIVTTAGPIYVASFMGRVQEQDVGKRIFHVPCHDPAALWIWQVENNSQRDARLEGSKP